MKKKRKVFGLVMAVMVLLLSACGNGNQTGEGESTSGGNNGIADPVTLLTTVWDAHSEDDKFPVAGGDYAEAVMDAPGSFGLDDAEMVDSVLVMPASMLSKIKSAASLMHMMNANTFTCGVFELNNSADADAVAKAWKEQVATRQWVCGMPDKMIVEQVDNYLVCFFGEEGIVDTFKAKLEASYSGVKTLYDTPVQ